MTMRRKNTKTGKTILTVFLFILAAAICVAAPLVVDTLELTCVDSLKVEAGQNLPSAADFLPDNEKAEKQQVSFVTDMTTVSSDVPGVYPVQLSYKGRIYNSQLVIADTVAPTATAQDATAYGAEQIDPKLFVTDIKDATTVTVTFAKEPDLTASEQQVDILLTDLGGNETRLQAKLTLIIDETAPEIKGVKDLSVYAGGTVSYRTGITATDDLDPNPTLAVDSTGVDLSVPGEYTVTYTATDLGGNVTTATAKVTVLEKGEDYVEPEVIYEHIDNLMAKFIREDMTDREKVEAVYCWTRMHFQYGKSTKKTDYLQIAYEFLQTHKGDCVSYFALQKLMLERLGIPTIDVHKVKNYEGDSNHYWLLVSIDQGQSYYHFDNVWSKQLCLVTDKRLNAFSKACKNCFNRDQSLYPPTPEEDLPYSALPWNDPDIVNTKP